MAEYQEKFSKLLSISSSENRDSTDSSSDAEPGRRDEEFYEKIEAPKFVDFTVPDHYHPDDRYWFCLRVGCDQKHEEEMDSEEVHKNFVLRVMAARSPNVRFRKALDRNASRTPVKCPLSAPPKSSKLRSSRIAILSSISDDKKKVVRPLLKPKSTPVTKTKPVAAKYLTTPRNNKCSQNRSSFRSVQHPKSSKLDEPKSQMVAKALVFNSPKKAIKVKTSVELRTPISKLCDRMNKLEISSQRKHALCGKSSNNLSNNTPKRQLTSCKVQRSPDQTCTNQGAKSGRAIKSKVTGKYSQQEASKKLSGNDHKHDSENNETHDIKQKLSKEVTEEIELQEYTHEEACMSSMVQLPPQNTDLATPDDSKGEGKCSELQGSNTSRSPATKRQGDDNNNENENSSVKVISKSRGESMVHLNENASSEGERNCHEFTDGDDKENATASDGNRMHNMNQKQNGRKVFGMHDKSSQVKKVAQAQDKNSKGSLISPGPVTKLKKPKPTNPKPFRLRTDERGILKEANLERRTDTLAPQSENANVSTPGGKLQRKQGNDIQKGESTIVGRKISRGQEGLKAAPPATPPQRNYSLTRAEPKSKTSPLKNNATQRLEKFRRLTSQSPLQKQSIRPQGVISTAKEMTSFLIPGQKLEVIHESSPEVSELPRTGKATGSLPRSCTNKLK